MTDTWMGRHVSTPRVDPYPSVPPNSEYVRPHVLYFESGLLQSARRVAATAWLNVWASRILGRIGPVTGEENAELALSRELCQLEPDHLLSVY
jgi:hypothetical protein